MNQKFANLGTMLSRAQSKKIVGGLENGDNCGSSTSGGCCNVYCGTGKNITCSGSCGTCGDAGNGSGSGQGEDKMCQS